MAPHEPSGLPQSLGTLRRELRRQQTERRREVLTTQARLQLWVQPPVLRGLDDFWRADRLAVRHKDRELERFLSQRARVCVLSWMKFFRRYRGAGRPRGTGHPKAKLAELLQEIGLDRKAEARLRKTGLTDRDFMVLYAYIRRGSQKAAADELRVSPQAINRRLKHRIEPALRRINPKFSAKFLRDVTAETAAPPRSK